MYSPCVRHIMSFLNPPDIHMGLKVNELKVELLSVSAWMICKIIQWRFADCHTHCGHRSKFAKVSISKDRRKLVLF